MHTATQQSPWLARTGWLFVACVLLLIVHLLYVFWPYQEKHGVDYFRQQVQQEYHAFSARADATAQATAKQIHAVLYRLLFIHTGLARYLVPPVNALPGPGLLSTYSLDVCWTLYYALLQFSLRLGILAEMLPWFGVSGLVALVDGCGGRSQRRHLVAAESAFLYCRARDLAVFVWLIILLLYLPVPWPMSPEWVFFPALLLFTCALRIMACYFRKYL